MYPELWLHELAQERQREMREFAMRWARRGIGEEPGASNRLPTWFRRWLKARKSSPAVGNEGHGKLDTSRDLELAATASQVVDAQLDGTADRILTLRERRIEEGTRESNHAPFLQT